MEITVVRVGADREEMTLAAAEALKSAPKIVLHTERCGCADWLKENGIAYDSLDELYEKAEDFDDHARIAAEKLLSYNDPSVFYCVLDYSDESVKRLFASGAKVKVLAKGADALLARAEGPVTVLSAMDIESAVLHGNQNTLVREIDTRAMAGDVKLALMRHYPEESPVYVLKPDGNVAVCPLTELDRLRDYDHRCACLAPAVSELTRLESFDYQDLMRLVKRLRDPVDGCPWDKVQTHETLKRALVEEAYELEDAIEKNDEAGILEELGDILFDALLQICVGVDHGEFEEADVTTGIARKMIFRHSHVFSSQTVQSVSEVSGLWQDAKKSEKGFQNTTDEICAVAEALPSLLRAQKVLKKAFQREESRAQIAFNRTIENCENGQERFGNELLKLVLGAFKDGIDAESALQNAVKRYIRTFSELSM